MTSLFVSYGSADRATARELQLKLRAAGFMAAFLDVDPDAGIGAGQNWERELYTALRRSDAVIFVSSAASVESKWCFAEVTLARSSGKPVFPVRVPGGPRLELLGELQDIDLSDGESAIVRLVDGLRRAGLDPADSYVWDHVRSPYPGLAPFATEDAAMFFGRATEVTQVLQLLQPTMVRGIGRWVGIVGPSGSGKSSLLRAGVVPRLSRQPDRWVVVPPFTPGTRPTRSLASALCRAMARYGVTVSVAALERDIDAPDTGSESLTAWVQQLMTAASGASNVLLAIDQAEELVTRVGPRDQTAFLRLLSRALSENSPLWVVSTMRSEFLSTAPERTGVTEVIDDHVVLEPLSRSRLPEVILRPARRAGLDFEVGLVERMVEETTGGDALPLLAYTLRELAKQAMPDGTITIASYDSIGGVVGGVRQRADQLIEELKRHDLDGLVLPTLLRLTAVDDNGTPVRRRLPRSELKGDELAIVDAFVEARLLVSTTDEDSLDAAGETDPDRDRAAAGSQVVAIAHEALLRQWPPLRKRIDNSRADLRLRANLEREAADWMHSGRDASYLLRGARLATVGSWADEHASDLDSRQCEFLEASRSLADEEFDRTRRLNHRLRRLVVGLAVFLIVALAASAIAVQQRSAAREEAALALARQLLAQAALVRDAQPDVSLLLGVEALRQSEAGQEEARAALLDGLNRSFHVSTRLAGHVSGVRSVAFRPDGKAVASGGEDGMVRLWDPVTGQVMGQPSVASGDGVPSVQFSPDGSMLAAAAGSAVRLWRIGAGSPTDTVLNGHDDVVYRIAFSPDGSLLATASGDGTVRLWDVTSGFPRGEPLRGHNDAVFDVRFSPDGTTLASASWDASVRLWDVATGVSRATLRHDEAVTTLAFSPDGSTLAAAGDDATVRLWDVGTGELRRELIGHTQPVTVVAFAPDGATVAAGSEDATVLLWDVAAGEPRGPALTGHTDSVVDLEFAGGGALVASASNDGTVRLWDVLSNAPFGEPLTGHTGWINDIGVSNDGASLVTGSGDGTARVWQVRTTVSPVKRMLAGAAGRLRTLAIGPGGAVAAAGDSGRVHLWAGSGHGPPRELAGLDDPVNAVAVSTRGDVAAGGDGREIRLWRSTGDAIGEPIAVPDVVLDLAFNPEATIIAAACADSAVRLWDVATGTLRAELRGYGGSVTAVAFDARGMLASGSEDRTVRLSDGTTGKPIGEPHETAGQILGLAFSPDGSTLASSGTDGTIRLWDGATGAPRETQPIGQHSWIYKIAFRPDGNVLASAADEGAQLWAVATGRPTGRPLVQRAGPVRAVAFGPDGSTLATIIDGNAWTWDLGQDDLVAAACRIANRNLSPEEQVIYLGSAAGGPTTCP